MNNIWHSIESDSFESIPDKDIGYKGIRVECNQEYSWLVWNTLIIKKSESTIEVKKDSRSKMENVLLNSIPNRLTNIVDLILYSNNDIIERQAG